MFKITALVAMLAVGAPASVALASSSRSLDRRNIVEPARIERRYDRFDARFDNRFDHRDLRDGRWSFRGARDDFGPRHYRPTWVALSTSMQLADAGRDSIRVSDPSTFTQIRMQVTGGVTRVDRVIVRFADGSSQVAELDRVLDDRNDLLELPLDGNNRRIDRITVIGNSDRCGALQLYGI
jgi:hypothetical protein